MKFLSKLTEKMKESKKFELVVYGALVIAGILIYVSTFKGLGGESVEHEPVDNVTAAEITEGTVEKRLEETLACISGAGRVKVMITYDTGAEIVPAMSYDTQTSSSQGSGSSSESKTESKKPVTIAQNGVTEPIVLTEVLPTVRGVIVVAEGARDFSVRINLQTAVCTVLGVNADIVEVFEMKSEGQE